MRLGGRALASFFFAACAVVMCACSPTAKEHAAVEEQRGNDPPLKGEALCEGRYATPFADLNSWSTQAHRRAAAAIECDAYEIMTHAWSTGLPPADVEALYARTLELRRSALDALRASPVESSRLPLSDAHRQMYTLAAEAERAAGASALRVWAANPWAPLSPLQRPESNGRGSLSLALMRGERRAVAFNVRNASATPRTVRIQLAASWLSPATVNIYQVNWTGNDQSTWAAAELQALGDASVMREATVLPGVTQQIWMEIHPGVSAAPGRFNGEVTLLSDGEPTMNIPLELKVFRSAFPDHPTLQFGGWDYTDDPRPGYAVTDANRLELAKHLQARYVDTPWAHSGGVLHWKYLGTNGEAIAAVDATLLARWLAAWPDARRFRVYVNVTDYIGGIHKSDANFSRAVYVWAHAWAAEIRRLNKSPEQFDLLLVDEPQTQAQATRTEVWARAIREAGAGFRIWMNPLWRNPLETPESLIEVADTISINLSVAEQAGTSYWEWARMLANRGKTIEIYATDGPARRLDPYRYFRLAAWRAFAENAANLSFWCLSDTGDSATIIGGSPSDNEFAATGHNYSPLFINRAEVRSGKHMEAAVQGIQDMEYLRMLQRIAQEHSSADVRARASGLLIATEGFLQASSPISSAQWRVQPESSGADNWRIAIGEFLDSLGS